MTMKLSRNKTNGAILADGAPVVLRGGHYRLPSMHLGTKGYFSANDPSQRLFAVTLNGDGCPVAHPAAADLPWGQDPNPDPKAVLGGMAGCNLLRIFLDDGVEVDDQGRLETMHPFARTANGKWRVKDAVDNDAPGAWDDRYFQRLADFAEAANTAGVAVQYCLFSHHNFLDTGPGNFQYFPGSFWNSDNADDPAWGRTWLIDKARHTTPLDRELTFMTDPNMQKVQTTLLHRILKYVSPFTHSTTNTRPNVIFELMNEPRGDNLVKATFLNKLTQWIHVWLGANAPDWLPLITANDFSGEVATWAQNKATLYFYNDIDAVSYHGLTARTVKYDMCGRTGLSVVATDRASIAQRVTDHRNTHPYLAMIGSTDGLRISPQQFGDQTIERRDGQIATALVYESGASPRDQVVRGDLKNWAYECILQGLGKGGAPASLPPGVVHFQNHSADTVAFGTILAAWVAAQAHPSQ